MKATTLRNRLEKRYTGSKSAKAYQIVKDLINGEKKTYMVFENRIRPVATSGSKRFTTNLDYTQQTINLLNLIGIKHEFTNDAPKGGLTGNLITIKTKIEQA